MCDLLVALPSATGGPTIFAKNSDRPPVEQQLLEFSSPRRDSVTHCTYIDVEAHPSPTLPCLISRPAWCWGAEHGVNAAGVAVGNASIFTVLDPRPFPDALIGMDLVRLALERATDAHEATALITLLLERHGQGGSGHHPSLGRRPYWSSFLIADPRDAWVVETSGSDWEAHRVDDVWALSNRTTIASFEPNRHPAQPVATLVDPRLDSTRALLSTRPVGVDRVTAHLASHIDGSGGWSVCMHVDGVQQTTASMVATLPDGAEPEVLVAPGNPCVTPFERVRLGVVPRSGLHGAR